MRPLHPIRVAVLLLIATCGTAGDASRPRNLLATIVSADADLLPARVMMLSARRNGGLPPSVARTIFVTEAVSRRWAQTLVEHDGLSFEVLPALPLAASTEALIPLFALTAYDAVLYLSPYALVHKGELAALFRCKPFCAMFHTPCSFSTGLMTLTPAKAVHDALAARARALRDGTDTSCRRENAPDWLEEEACILNAHFGKRLLNASVFRGEVDEAEAGVRRLAAGTKMAHYLYYPRMGWDIPDKCGPLQTVDYTTPPLLRPWYWWTFAAMDLSWSWREYRVQLTQPAGMPDAERQTFLMHVAGIFVVVVVGVVMLKRGLRGGKKEGAKAQRANWMREQELMLYVWAGGLVGCCGSWGVGMVATPAMIAPEYGIVLFGMYRTVALWGFWCVFGSGFIARRAVAEDGRRLRGHGRRGGLARTGLICMVESVCMILLLVCGASVKTETAFGKIVALASAFLLYCAVGLVVIVWLGRLWLAVGAKGRLELNT